MYNSYFGFREKPFKLVPDPDFIFLSKIHEIALAHLTYAVSQGDGFVVITGEVGTGKTTLCRMFLERLDENVESAYIFNPRLDSVQLLTTICNEFGIRTNFNNLKQLLDVINGYLIMKNKEGRKVLLVIDEAQNLSVENLEMVRMLSNLETTRSKLLQIILVGQPELADKLDSYELRQLAQRISLSAHLTPLGLEEMSSYIQHRINIAAQRHAKLFTRGALKYIYQFSNGIPRKINIVCDRALLTAFSLSRPQVTTAIVRVAIQELSHRRQPQPPTSALFKRIAIWSAACLGAVILSGAVYSQIYRIGINARKESVQTNTDSRNQASGDASSVKTEVAEQPIRTYKIQDFVNIQAYKDNSSQAAEAGPSEAALPAPKPIVHVRSLGETINSLEHQTSRLDAVTRILECWQQPAPNAAQLPVLVDDDEYFDIAAHQYGLRMYLIRSDLVLVKQLNLPAIVAFNTSIPGDVVYMTMVGWHQGKIDLASSADGETVQTDLESLLPHLSGPLYIYWENAMKVDGVITVDSSVRDVRVLKNLLFRVGYTQIELTPDFDGATQEAIMDFQLRHNLTPDGLAGPVTKIFLIRDTGITDYPQLDGPNWRDGE